MAINLAFSRQVHRVYNTPWVCQSGQLLDYLTVFLFLNWEFNLKVGFFNPRGESYP